MIDLEFRLIVVVTARHALRTQHELGEEGDIEADEDDPAGDRSKTLVVHATEDLRPPMVQTTDHSDQCTAHHHVVEVGNYKVGVVQVHVGTQCGQVQAGETADGEQEQECQRVPHRCGQ